MEFAELTTTNEDG